jgi:hypothetical protein
MTHGVVGRRSSASQVLDSPLRHVAAAIAVSSGFAYVLEAEDQFHRAVWFGVLFAAITGGWFIIGSFLTLVDTRATWQLLRGRHRGVRSRNLRDRYRSDRAVILCRGRLWTRAGTGRT